MKIREAFVVNGAWELIVAKFWFELLGLVFIGGVQVGMWLMKS